MSSLTITAPDDWHLHLRDAPYLATTVPHTAQQFSRAIIMPNLVPPITKVSHAKSYRERILQHGSFEPLMTLYLTDKTDSKTIEEAHKSTFIHGIKLYPQGATTHSDQGVTSLKHCQNAFAAMENLGMPLLVHGEVTRPEVDIYQRETVFIRDVLSKIIDDFPNLKIVLEHISTADAVDFVRQAKIAATITPHHLWSNRNDMLVGGIKPHYYCLPILKRASDQQALIQAATSGEKQFFLGTDSAPHTQNSKESPCGCAGVYSAHAALPLYTSIFEQANALDKLEGFASHFGPDFYGLPRNSKKITLIKESWQVPEYYTFGDERLVPFLAGQQLEWQVSGA